MEDSYRAYGHDAVDVSTASITAVLAAHLALLAQHVYYTYMTKKLTITVSDETYERLHRRIGRRKISRFIDDLTREHFMEKQLVADYAEAAADEQRERDAKEWIESGVDEGLPDEDFSDWPGRPTRWYASVSRP